MVHGRIDSRWAAVEVPFRKALALFDIEKKVAGDDPWECGGRPTLLVVDDLRGSGDMRQEKRQARVRGGGASEEASTERLAFS